MNVYVYTETQELPRSVAAAALGKLVPVINDRVVMPLEV